MASQEKMELLVRVVFVRWELQNSSYVLLVCTVSWKGSVFRAVSLKKKQKMYWHMSGYKEYTWYTGTAAEVQQRIWRKKLSRVY